MWQKSKDWVVRHAQTPGAVWFLAGLSFIESIISPLPNDTLLVIMTFIKKERWFFYATVSTVASLVGAVAGYFIGLYLFDIVAQPLIHMYHAEEHFERVKGFFKESVFLFTLIGAITPIPYKIFVLGAGFMKVNFPVFMLASAIGRGARFYAVTYVTARYGERGIRVVTRYSIHLTIIGVALMGVYIIGSLLL